MGPNVKIMTAELLSTVGTLCTEPDQSINQSINQSFIYPHNAHVLKTTIQSNYSHA